MTSSLNVNIAQVLKMYTSMPLHQRCSSLAHYFPNASPKDLRIFFPSLVDDIFGRSDANSLGWNLMCTTMDISTTEWESLVSFLDPSGPLIALSYRLMADPGLKYEFPMSLLPEATRKALEAGSVTNFLASKMYLGQSNFLLLNPFEYYIFTFTHYITKPNNLAGLSSTETIYSRLLQNYLKYFLPLEGDSVPPISSLEKIRVTSSFPSHLMKSSSLNFMSPMPEVKHPSGEIWRTETLLLAVMEFWLNNTDTSNQELIMMLRIFIKHIHYFANSGQLHPSATLYPCGAPPLNINLLKCQVIRDILQKPLYSFFVFTFDHWPLDTSFRVPLEAWLSFIQPWRYIPTSTTAQNPDHPVEEQWINFISENLPFYTTILLQVLPRFFRMELDSYKTSYCLYRITKVFAQENLVDLILKAESHSSVLEDPDYVPLLSDSVRTMVSQLLLRMKQAKTSLTSPSSPPPKERFWLSSIWNFSFSGDSPDSSTDSKVACYLDLSIDNLCKIFKLHPPSLSEDLSLQSSRLDDSQDFDPLSQSLTAQGRYKLLNGLQLQHAVEYRGHPDLRPICSFEVAFLVRLFWHLTNFLNLKYGRQMEERYNRQDVIGWLCRHILAPPTVYHEGTVAHTLPPRLRLRALAHRQVVLFYLVLIGVAYISDIMWLLMLALGVLTALLGVILIGPPSFPLPQHPSE